MPVPKEKKSRSKRDMRRAWHDRMDPPTTVECPRCHETKQPHRVCPHCGYYRDREVFPPTEEETAPAARKK